MLPSTHLTCTPPPPSAVATSQTDPLNELNATMDRMRKVAEGSIEAPPTARQDAATALGVCGSIIKAPDLWDGTVDDLAGYLRMMGALIKGMIQIKEVIPPLNNKPAPPVFDVFITETLAPGGEEQKPGNPIYGVFLAGDPKTVDSEIFCLHYDVESARQEFESYDPAIRDVVGACAVLQMATVVDGSRSNAEISYDLFKLALDKLRCFELETAQDDAVSGVAETCMDPFPVLAILQQVVKDKLGVTREEINLEEVMFFCHWRMGATMLGIDNYLVEKELLSLSPDSEYGGRMMLEGCSQERPEYLPPYYDFALYMGSKPSMYTPKKALDAALRGLNAHHSNEGGPWAQLRMQWIAAKAILAGALSLPMSQEGQVSVVLGNHVYKFTPAQLMPYVEAADVLLDRMRPWLGDVAAFKQIDKGVKGWRKKYITGKDESFRFAAIPMGCVASQWAARDGEKQCAACGNSSDKLKVCSACKQVWYCNATCQKAGWKAHKKACSASKKT